MCRWHRSRCMFTVAGARSVQAALTFLTLRDSPGARPAVGAPDMVATTHAAASQRAERVAISQTEHRSHRS
eukprot:360973-Chlamydomonas_euryale.AAC.3